jgi:hypothetical protein
MADDLDLDRTLLRLLLDKELHAFRDALEGEDPGLSDSEIDRYMRGARMFAARLIMGASPRTRGRKHRKS